MTVVEPNASDALAWIEQSLAAGQAVSAAVLAQVAPDGDRARLWVSENIDPTHMPTFQEGGVAKESEATAWLVNEIDGMAARGARCLIVEDALSRPSDPALKRSEIPVAFLGESVLSWCQLPPVPGRALPDEVIRVGGGFPTNAFVLSASVSELGLSDRQQLPVAFPRAVAASVEAVAVSVHDAESYLVWERDLGP